MSDRGERGWAARAEGLEAQEPRRKSSHRAFLKLLELFGCGGPDLGASGGPQTAVLSPPHCRLPGPRGQGKRGKTALGAALTQCPWMEPPCTCTPFLGQRCSLVSESRRSPRTGPRARFCDRGEGGLPWLQVTIFLEPEGLRLADTWYFVIGTFVLPSS